MLSLALSSDAEVIGGLLASQLEAQAVALADDGVARATDNRSYRRSRYAITDQGSQFLDLAIRPKTPELAHRLRWLGVGPDGLRYHFHVFSCGFWLS